MINPYEDRKDKPLEKKHLHFGSFAYVRLKAETQRNHCYILLLKKKKLGWLHNAADIGLRSATNLGKNLTIKQNSRMHHQHMNESFAFRPDL